MTSGHAGSSPVLGTHKRLRSLFLCQYMKPFRFKQFAIHHSNSSMKLGTDAVLLGAWVSIPEANMIFEAGTGCGVISLMLAQNHPQAQILALDIHEASVSEAQINAAQSPFASRIKVRHADLFDFQTANKFDLLVSNPPFFEGDLKAPDLHRNRARHQQTDRGLYDWTMQLRTFMHEHGAIALILPKREHERLEAQLNSQNLLWMHKKLSVSSYKDGEVIRILSLWRTVPCELCELQSLFLYDAPGKKSEAYLDLCSDFYL